MLGRPKVGIRTGRRTGEGESDRSTGRGGTLIEVSPSLGPKSALHLQLTNSESGPLA